MISIYYAKVRTLEFSSVMYSIDLQLSLLHAIWNFQVKSGMFSTDLQLSLLHAKV